MNPLKFLYAINIISNISPDYAVSVFKYVEDVLLGFTKAILSSRSLIKLIGAGLHLYELCVRYGSD